MAAGLMLDEDEFHAFLTEAFAPEKQAGQNYVSRERFMNVLKQLPGFDLTDKELTTIGAICKHSDGIDGENLDWVDFMSWAYVTISSLSRERMVLHRGQDEMATNITSKKRHAVKMKELSDVSKKLLNLVRLKLDETSKSLALTLPWEVALSSVKAVGSSDNSSGSLDFSGLGRG